MVEQQRDDRTPPPHKQGSWEWVDNNRHLPFANELLYDLAVFYRLKLKEDQACQVIRRTAKKLSQIIRQDYVGQLTDEWKIYQGQDIPEECTSLDIKEMDPTPTGNECSGHKTQ